MSAAVLKDAAFERVHPRNPHTGEWIKRGGGVASALPSASSTITSDSTAFRTIGEAQDWFEGKGIDLDPGALREAAGAPELFGAWARAVDAVLKRHPELEGEIDQIAPGRTTDEPAIADRIHEAEIMTLSFPGTSLPASIYFNDDPDNLNQLKSRASFNALVGISAKSNLTPEGRMTHELGHAAFAKIAEPAILPHLHPPPEDPDEARLLSRQVLQSMFDRQGITKEWLEENVSVYAASATEEAFAELYGMLHTPGAEGIRSAAARKKALAFAEAFNAAVGSKVI